MSEVLGNAGEACLLQMPGCLRHIESARPSGEFHARLQPQRSSQEKASALPAWLSRWSARRLTLWLWV